MTELKVTMIMGRGEMKGFEKEHFQFLYFSAKI